MNKRKHWKTFFSLALFTTLTLFTAGCYNSGMRFLRDVNETVCCFSPALVLAPAVLIMFFNRQQGD